MEANGFFIALGKGCEREKLESQLCSENERLYSIILIYKVKGRSKCTINRGITYISIHGKLSIMVFKDRVMDFTDILLNGVQCSFQIFELQIILIDISGKETISFPCI